MVTPDTNLASRPTARAVVVCNLWVSASRGGQQGFRTLDLEDGSITLLRNVGTYRRILKKMQLTRTVWVESLKGPHTL
jgi:hypothetical protein